MKNKHKDIFHTTNITQPPMKGIDKLIRSEDTCWILPINSILHKTLKCNAPPLTPYTQQEKIELKRKSEFYLDLYVKCIDTDEKDCHKYLHLYNIIIKKL